MLQQISITCFKVLQGGIDSLNRRACALDLDIDKDTMFGKIRKDLLSCKMPSPRRFS